MNKSYTKNETDLMHQPMHEKLDKILEQTTTLVHRIGKLEVWKAKIDGISTATKGISKGLWSVFGLFIVTGVLVLFQMYSSIQNLPVAISSEVEKQLNGYQFEIIQ